MAPFTLSKTLLTAAGLLCVGLQAFASPAANTSRLIHAHDHATLEMHGHAHLESHGQAIPHLEIRATAGQAVAGGAKLRILPLGDSITYGFASPDGNGYRLKLSNALSANDLVFAGTLQGGTMIDNWNSGFSGKTIQYIAGAAGPALAQKPNVVLLLAGTNDMSPNPATSLQGTDANGAAQRLGNLIDQILAAVPSVVVLVGKIPQNGNPTQNSNTNAYNALIPGVVNARASAGKHVRLVDFSVIGVNMLVDGTHPTEAGYQEMGSIWYNAIAAIPSGWVKAPIGPDPNHPLNCGGNNELSPITGGASSNGARGDLSANGGPDPNIPAPVFHNGKLACEIALGLGHPGDWKYHEAWVSGGQIVSGLHLDMAGVQLYDMDGDGKAEYLWVNQDTGQLTCWKNNYPALWAPCGNNGGIIASGAGPRDNVFFADMNGDGKTDYLVVNANTGSVTVYWNEGPDASFVNGWRFTPGGVIATGVPHANLRTLRFADMDGDGRADYVYVGVGGSLGLWLNTGLQGGHDVLFVNQGGIATGASPDIDNVVLSDINGDGRADYLVWDSIGGLGGYLNIRTRDEGTPYFAAQGGAKTIADGISQNPGSIRLADIDGDGLVDYCYIDTNGAMFVWWNGGGATDASVDGDGVRLADMDGDHIDDYIWLDEATGAPTVYLNKGPKAGAPDGWFWAAQNGGKPVASGAGPRANIHFGDIDGDNRTDYLVLDPKSGAVTAYLNGGPTAGNANSWIWKPVGVIASGLGPGQNARFADLDGDGKADYIQLGEGGKAIVWKNNYPKPWSPFAALNAAGVGRPPAEISFADLNGDGKADYIWTDPISGQPHVWYNKYPAVPSWQAGNYLSISRDGVSGPSILYATLTKGGSAVPVFVNPDNGAIAAFVNGCSGTSTKRATPTVEELLYHPKRELRKRASCGNGGVLSPSTSPLPPITTCPVVKPYNPARPFDASPCRIGNWFGMQCEGSVTNSLDLQRYFDVDGPDAWQSALNYWNNYLAWNKLHTISPGVDTESFSEVVSNYFHGPIHFACENIEDGTVCPSNLQCSTQGPNSPAGWLILSSLGVLHDFGNAAGLALMNATAKVNGRLGIFSSSFVKLADTQERNLAIDAILTVASLGLGATAGRLLEQIRQASETFGSKLSDAVQNAALISLGSISGFVHDALSETATAADVQVLLSDYLTTLGGYINAATTGYFHNLLSANDEGNQTLLGNYINGGFLTWDSFKINFTALESDAERALWGALIIDAWANSPEPVYPFIMQIPNYVYKVGADASTAKGYIRGDKHTFSEILPYPTKDLRVATWHDADNSYFLLDAGDNKGDCVGTAPGGENPGCPLTADVVGLLPGGTNTVLKSGNEFGGITIADMISSNVAGFRLNGNKNGFKSSQFVDHTTNINTFETSPAAIAYSGGITTPGFFNFPVCVSVDGYLRDRDNWYVGGADTPRDYDPNYPCGLFGKGK